MQSTPTPPSGSPRRAPWMRWQRTWRSRTVISTATVAGVVAGAALIQSVDPAPARTSADPADTRADRSGARAAATSGPLGVPDPAAVPGGAFGTDPSSPLPGGPDLFGAAPGPQTVTRGS